MTDSYNTAKVIEREAKELEEHKDYKIAAERWAGAADVWNKFNNEYNRKKCLALSFECMSKYYKDLEDFTKSQEHFLNAANLWEEIGQDANSNWCKANFHSSHATSLFFDKKYEVAKSEFELAAKLFAKIADEKTNKYCLAFQSYCEAFLLKTDKKFDMASKMFFESSHFAKLSENFQFALKCEAHAWMCLGLLEKINDNFENAIKHFDISSSIFDKYDTESSSKYWSLAQIHECKYFISKESGYRKGAIQNMRDAITYFEKSNDPIAPKICCADLNRQEGLLARIDGKYSKAIEHFEKSKNIYLELSSLNSEYNFHSTSALYLNALALGTQADIELFIKNNPKTAAEKYRAASEEFEKVGDSKSAFQHNKFSNFSLAIQNLLDGNAENALKIWNFTTPSIGIPQAPPYEFKPQNAAKFINLLGKLVAQRTQESFKEIIQFDKGPGFESRMRDLVGLFDNRMFNHKGSLNTNSETIDLHKYTNVKRKTFTPEEDEIGIVFDDKTPIEIDILAERLQGNKKALFIGECKDRPNNEATIKDIELFIKKINFVRIRYEKLSRLEGMNKPVVENSWFFSVGGFTNDTKTKAKFTGITLLDKRNINDLLKEFKQVRLR